MAFYDFPAEHWQHLRTTNPIESAEQSWRRIKVPEKLGGIAFKDGITVTDSTPAQQPLAA